jgi:hypothetical protein
MGVPWFPRGRRGGSASPLGVAAVVAVLAVVLAACGAGGAGDRTTRPGSPTRSAAGSPSPSGSSATAPATSGRQAPSDYARLVLADGDRVHLAGRVVSVPHRAVRMCAPSFESGVGYAPGHEPAPQWCRLGTDVTGIHLSALTQRRSKGGAVEGWAQVEGVYHATGPVTVTAQHPYRPAPGPGFLPDQPPCPAPPGGWPVGREDADLDVTPLQAYSDAHPGSVVMPAELRPSRRQVLIYALTAGDPAPVEAALRPAYGPALCVVRSRYGQAQIASAAAAFRPDGRPAGAGVSAVSGGGLARDEQVVVDVSLVRVTAGVAALAARQPAGLVRLHPWMYPASVPATLVE